MAGDDATSPTKKGPEDGKEGGESPNRNGGEDPGNFDGEEEGDDDDDDGVVWEELFACPLTVRFTQEKIHPFFYRRGPIVNVVPKIRIVPNVRSGDTEPLGVSPAEIARGMVLELVPPFGQIHVLRKGKEMWSLDNRRLYALQYAAMQWWPQQCCVRLLSSDRLPRKKFKTQSEGQIVHICARYQQFDTWNWFETATEREWYTLNNQLGYLLSTFETLPVIGALLFRTGLTGLTSRTPLIVAFLLTFALDFIRQKVPAFEKRISELHVKAVMDGDIKYWPSCRKKQQARFTQNGYEDTAFSVSAPQLASMMALLMILTLPYVLSIPHDKVRSSVFYCWLGISCVLVVQLSSIIRAGTLPEVLRNTSEGDMDGEEPEQREHRLPKAPHRESSGNISPKHTE
jgi:hypothetical protein